MTSFKIASTIPAEIADNGSTRMGGGIKCQLISCLAHPAAAPAAHVAHGIFAGIRALFGL